MKAVTGAKIAVGTGLAVAAWTLLASLAFLLGTGLIGDFAHPFYQWWIYLLYARDNPTVVSWLEVSAAAATLLLAGAAAALAIGGRRIGPSIRPRLLGGASAPIRGRTDNLGHADWLAIKDAMRIFPGPNTTYGGVVIGEAYRVDQDKVAKTPFDPRDNRTWSKGGKAPLLVDPCEAGPTHSLVFAGAGSFKSMSAVSTLLTWTGSSVVLDPAGELGAMTAAARERMGHAVHRLDLRSGMGFNVLDWIDIGSPTATTNVLSVVSWVCGDPPNPKGSDKANEFFESRGRSLVACLLAHMLWDDTLDPELKTLATLRRGISAPEPMMKQALQGIHENSKSPLARQYAGTLKDLVEETFSGIYAHADESTAWLANPAFAAIVSGTGFKTSDLRAGNTTVFLQLSLAALQTTPALARCVIGALLNSAYEADGAIKGRILYLLDEAARLGPLKIIEVARDAGRKYGITLQLLYQSVGQLERQWGREGKREWYDGVSHRTYAAIQDIDTARELEETFGQYGVMATSAGSHAGTSGKSFEIGARSRGRNENYHEISRALIRREELMNDTRTDEAFVVIRGAKPLRCGRAIYFRRPELVSVVEASKFATIAAE